MEVIDMCNKREYIVLAGHLKHVQDISKYVRKIENLEVGNEKLTCSKQKNPECKKIKFKEENFSLSFSRYLVT